ncbi:Rsph14, partial [Symbiodinium sp. KB8]
EKEEAVLLNALSVMARMLNTAANTAKACDANIVEALNNLAGHESAELRSRLSGCLATLASFPAGKSSLVKDGALPVLAKLMNDKDKRVRRNSLQALERLSKHVDGCEALVSSSFVKDCLHSALEDGDATCKATALAVLSSCVACHNGAGLKQGLSNDGPAACVSLLGHEVEAVRSAAAKALFYFMCSDEGKEACVKAAAVQPLLKCLQDSATAVAANAAQALMSVAIIDAGKSAILAGGVDAIIKALSAARDTVLLVNVLQLVAAAAGRPEIRAEFVRAEVPQVIEGIVKESKARNSTLPAAGQQVSDASLRVAKVAEKALALVTWTP